MRVVASWYLPLSVALTIGCYFLQSPMINNGDFFRVANGMSIHVDPWAVFGDKYSIGDLSFKWIPPYSTMEFTGFAIVGAHKLFGLNLFFSSSIFWCLSFIYFLGAHCLAKKLSGKVRLIVLLAFYLEYICFSFYFKSLYEEAAVLMLSPWVLVSLLAMSVPGRIWPFFFVSFLVILAKAQMIFLLPLFVGFITLKTRANKFSFSVIALGILILVFAAFASVERSKSSDLSLMNSYNRFFNGIGWVAQGVESWDRWNFNERLLYFKTNKENLQTISVDLEPMNCCKLMGTTFWPDFHQHLSENPGSTDQFISHTKKNASAVNFLGIFWRQPELFVDYFTAIPFVAATSDYSLSYIRTKRNTETFSFSMVAESITRYTGAFYLVIGGFLFFYLRDFRYKFLCIYYFFGAPYFVVIGDGFYEFEKHMLPYFMLCPPAALYLLLKDNQK